MAIELASLPRSVAYGLVVHTDMYAGNFERAMCAFMTGFVGDCGVGQEYADEACDTENFYAVVNGDMIPVEDFGEFFAEYVNDDHGCARPVSIVPGRGNDYNSFMIFFNDEFGAAADQLVPRFRERAYEFAKTYRSWSQAPITPINIIDVELVDLRVSKEPTPVADASEYILAAVSCANHEPDETGYVTFKVKVPWGAQLYIKKV